MTAPLIADEAKEAKGRSRGERLFLSKSPPLSLCLSLSSFPLSSSLPQSLSVSLFLSFVGWCRACTVAIFEKSVSVPSNGLCLLSIPIARRAHTHTLTRASLFCVVNANTASCHAAPSGGRGTGTHCQSLRARVCARATPRALFASCVRGALVNVMYYGDGVVCVI